jgi:hypothetical protein
MSLRRQVRLRKEYLYRKSLEGKDKAAYERKRLIRAALQGECIVLEWLQHVVLTHTRSTQ